MNYLLKETSNQVKFMVQNVAGVELNQLKDDMKKKVKGLERFAHNTIKSNEERTNCLRT